MSPFNFILWFFILIISSKTVVITTMVEEGSKGSKSIYQVLESKGLPMGLFPKGVTNYTVGEDGRFEVYLDRACNSKFESEIHYEKSVIGQLSFGRIGNLSGISAQDLFLWFPVKGIRVDIPSSGVIYFDVGVVHKQFSLSLFETPRDCVASSRPLSDIVGVLAKKLSGILRYDFEWWNNGGEVNVE